MSFAPSFANYPIFTYPDSVKLISPSAAERDIDDNIKVWLKHSPQRCKLKGSRQSLNNNTEIVK